MAAPSVVNNLLFCALSIFVFGSVIAWNDHAGGDSILLKDVNVLTLHSDRMTTGRRSSPVPQLKCVGGSASGSFVPIVVQCSNRGSDGMDVQWECKADMDNAYRFGKVEVLCEGYNYPDDPYILKGSCGLEYSLEFTKEGYEQQHGSNNHQHHQKNDYKSYRQYSKSKGSSWIGDLVMLAVVGVIIYAIYTTCIARGNNNADRGNNPPPYSEHTDHPRQGGNPPPYGFRNDYMPNANGPDCSGQSQESTYCDPNSQTRTNTGSASTGGGFWTGTGVGGMLGYLIGSRSNTGYGYGPSHGYDRRYGGSSWGNRGYGANNGWTSGWGSGGGGWGSTGRNSSSGYGGSTSSSSSTGTRTASGFGGTRRR